MDLVLNTTKGRLMTRTLLIGGAALLSATPAFAGGTGHGHGFASEILHWLSAPHHGIGAALAAVALIGGALYIKRRKA